MAGSSESQALLPRTVLKSKESAISQEKEGEGKRSNSSPCQGPDHLPAAGVTAAGPHCAQAGLQDRPLQGYNTWVPMESWLLYEMEAGPCFQGGIASPNPTSLQDPGDGAQ